MGTVSHAVQTSSHTGATVKLLVDGYEDLDNFVENKWAEEMEKLSQWHRAEKLGHATRDPGNATRDAEAAT